MPVAVRRGCSISVGATSAWTSTSSGRVPSIEQSTPSPARGLGLADEARRGIGDLDQSARAHLEDADLAGRAEAVLERAHRAEACARARPRSAARSRPGARAPAGRRASPPWSRARSGSWSTSSRFAASSSAPVASRTCGDAARAPVSSPAVRVWTESITQTGGPLGLERGQHRLERVLGEHRHLERALAEPLGAEPRSGRPTPRRRHRGSATRRRRGWRAPSPPACDLPIPGEPPSSTSEPGTRPPPSTRSSSAIPVRQPLGALGAHLAQRHRLAAAPGRSAPSRRSRPGAGAGAARSSVFQSPQPGHWPVQARARWPHSPTRVSRLRSWPPHSP